MLSYFILFLIFYKLRKIFIVGIKKRKRKESTHIVLGEEKGGGG